MIGAAKDGRRDFASRGDAVALRVLVVEDEALIALDLEEQLMEMGHDPVGIAPGTEMALRLARETKPDLAFVDLTLAGGDDGRDVATALRAEMGIPSILLSGSLHRLTPDDIARIVPAAMLSKPVVPGALARTLDRVATGQASGLTA